MAKEPDSAARRLTAVLRKTFKLDALRPGQSDVIERVLAGKSTLALMPTGAGKSLCYQLPATLLPGMTLVVSPLIALMEDQCSSLKQRGIRAVQVNSVLGSEALAAAFDAIATGGAQVVLTTPERLADPEFQRRVCQGSPVSLLVIDEAHCISQWGHDFRPAFLEIAAARKAFGQPPVLALTATAAEAVAADIRQQLGIPASGVIDTGSYRANLDYAVEALATDTEKMARTVALVRDSPGCGLVYAATVRAAEAVHEALLGADVQAVGLYHGRLPAAERLAVQQAFMDGGLRVVVATNAFGLGIDKQDIRFVVHHQMPGSLEAYYQETGRSGRDGERSTCTLLFHRKDRSVQQFFLAGRYPEADDLRALWRVLSGPPPEGGWRLPAAAKAASKPLTKLKVCMSLLRRHRLLSVGQDGVLNRSAAELDDAQLDGLLQAYRAKKAGDRASLEQMVDYAQSGHCRWQRMLEGIGHGQPGKASPCGHCDTCRRIADIEQGAAAQARAAA